MVITTILFALLLAGGGTPSDPTELDAVLETEGDVVRARVGSPRHLQGHSIPPNLDPNGKKSSLDVDEEADTPLATTGWEDFDVTSVNKDAPPTNERRAGDLPNPNPAPNSDNSKTYWCGNDMQWEIQEAIDDCSPGDIIVIRAGIYVDSPTVNKPNLTIRPFLTLAGEWEDVVFWSPTKGPQAQNGWGMYVGADTENTYIGRPRRFRQLTSGFISPTTIVPGEYMNPLASGIPVHSIDGPCFTFWSRSVDNTGIMCVDARATIENNVFSSESGFGGGAMLVGSANDTAFVDCTFEDLYANGTTLRTDVPGLAMPNYCISIHTATGGTMEYTFADCRIADNRGETIVFQDGGGGQWTDCSFESNDAETNFGGVLSLLGTNTGFQRCRFTGNASGFGTVFINGVGTSSLDPIRFFECDFEANTTIDGQWGGVIYAEDEASSFGNPSKTIFDGCAFDGNNGNVGVDPDDFVSPWFPTYRQGDYNESVISDGVDGPEPTADLNGDGVVDSMDLGLFLARWGTDGTP